MSPPVTSTLDRARQLSNDGADLALLACLEELLAEAPHPAPTLAAAEREALCHDRAEAFNLRGRSLTRLGRHAESLEAHRDALGELMGFPQSPMRVVTLGAMAFVYFQLGLPEVALKCATASFRMALSQNLLLPAAMALERLGMCYYMLGDPAQAERLIFEALGLALQCSDDAGVHLRLSNLLYLSCQVSDAYREAGNEQQADACLARCSRLIAQGDKLVAVVGAYQRCLWHSNRARWQRRRGQAAPAEAALRAVALEAAARGWTTVERHVEFELAPLLHQQGRHAEAIVSMNKVPLAAGSAESYDLSAQAHRLLRDWHRALNQPAEAQAHDTALSALRDSQAVLRDRAAARLAHVAEAVDVALAEADRLRLEAETARLAPRGR
jgi:tetratricopeptide (TPR) repeat protein